MHQLYTNLRLLIDPLFKEDSRDRFHLCQVAIILVTILSHLEGISLGLNFHINPMEKNQGGLNW